jgi:hypothetical protein
MRRIQPAMAVAMAAALLVPALTARAAEKPAAGKAWRLTGELSEACSCSVPCTCNFGEGPSPQHFCWALFSLDIRKGRYGKVPLDGLRLAGAMGGHGLVAYIDDRANPEQAEALKAIWGDIGEKVMKAATAADPKVAEDPSMQFRGFKTVRIQQEYAPKSNRLAIGDQGGFESDYIIGIDGKTPLVVENNWSWNIKRGIKGKTKYLRYKDEFGNDINLTATNANQGQFDWSDKTPVYFR